ncbi:MAG: IreB family regulatory phosphoprotein [Firmicutes bacterium]|nr:IreB family regulatory phosphoprotein [Bacillota bacterium]
MVDKETMMFKVEKNNADEAREILMAIYQALKERGYNPINQIVGYILSGDPTYITNHKNARNLVRKLERDELLEEILKFYLESGQQKGKK